MPAMIKLRDDTMKEYGYSKKIRIGAAGGIGTPEAAAAAFIMGADFLLTGSINQCTVEAGVSAIAKDLLQDINVQDTAYAPAADMFELGAKVQVIKKGVLFPARANKLYELYRRYNSIDEIDRKTKQQLQDKFFKLTFDEIYEDVKCYYSVEDIEKAEKNPKQKMAYIFRWYLGKSTHYAINGDEEQKVNFQILCGPALGAFNQWVKGSELENWHNRHVDEIAKNIMADTANLLNQRFNAFM
jgi:trans-AT polyketide synthase/acyltransferase/oxidoreductase domain-containing protein